MNTKQAAAWKSPGNQGGAYLMLVGARLKKLRRERQLVERAIIALTEVSKLRQPRERRTPRS
jgi:hypothetical protein